MIAFCAVFAVVAGVTFPRFGLAALTVAAATWMLVALGLYVSIVWLPRRRKSIRGTIARPTST
jgi:hypothetical protein